MSCVLQETTRSGMPSKAQGRMIFLWEDRALSQDLAHREMRIQSPHHVPASRASGKSPCTVTMQRARTLLGPACRWKGALLPLLCPLPSKPVQVLL